MSDVEKEAKKVKKKKKSKKNPELEENEFLAENVNENSEEKEEKKSNLGIKVFGFSMIAVTLGCVAGVILSFVLSSGYSPYGVTTLKNRAEFEDWDDTNRNSSFDSFVSKINSSSSKLFETVNTNLNDKKENVAYSPASMLFTYSMLYEISETSVQNKILDATGFTSSELGSLENVYSALNQDFINEETERLLGKEKLSNSIWLSDKFDYEDDVLSALSENSFADCYCTDFDGGNLRSNAALAADVSEFSEGYMNFSYNYNEETSFAILNNFYFNDIWNDLGKNLQEAGNRDFTSQDGSSKKLLFYKAPLTNAKINDKETYTSMFIETFDKFRIDFIVPKEGTDVDSLFTKEFLDAYDTYEYQTEEVVDSVTCKNITLVEFPEFSAGFHKDIKDSFFSSIDVIGDTKYESFASPKDEDDFYCSKIMHSTKVEVKKNSPVRNTSAIISESSSQNENEIKSTFRVNRSFVYTIKDRQGIKLFEGIVYKL